MGLFGDDDSERAGFSNATELKEKGAKRLVDREAGVVLYAMKIQKGDPTASGGFGLAAVPIDDTDLYFPDDEEE